MTVADDPRPSWWRAPLARLAGWREERALARRAIPEPLWQLTLARLPFVARLSEDDRTELRRLCSLFLDDKRFAAVDGLELTDEMALTVAAQACLPVLRLGLHYYRGLSGIVLRREGVVVQRSYMDEDGVVHEYDDTILGEVDANGMMMLSWGDADDAIESASVGLNVVIHEFAHVIDAATGAIDGIPPLPDAPARERWAEAIDAAYEDFCAMVDEGVDTVVDPYGAEAVDEFFAVAVEAFFVDPVPFRREWPDLYPMFADYFRQDPAARA
ncbi:MAG: zinc-dependent peptidase [Burkholderiaceae bacterium]